MSCSKPLPPFVCDSLYYLNRNQLERFSIVCRHLKNFIDRYFHSKPYRIFDDLRIHGGSYTLIHNYVHWHPNREDYNVQHFLAGQKCSIDESKVPCYITYYSFAEMRPYLAPTVRINKTAIFVAGDSTYNAELITEMESIAYLWRDGGILIWNADTFGSRIVAEDFLPILNSPTILQCHTLTMINAYFTFKDYSVLYTVKVLILNYNGYDDTDSSYWPKFLEQPGAKPIVALHYLHWENINTVLDLVKKAFSSAVLSNAFKVVFHHVDESLIEFCEINETSGEKLELKKGLPVEWQEELRAEYQEKYLKKYHNYTLERSMI